MHLILTEFQNQNLKEEKTNLTNVGVIHKKAVELVGDHVPKSRVLSALKTTHAHSYRMIKKAPVQLNTDASLILR